MNRWTAGWTSEISEVLMIYLLFSRPLAHFFLHDIILIIHTSVIYGKLPHPQAKALELSDTRKVSTHLVLHMA